MVSLTMNVALAHGLISAASGQMSSISKVQAQVQYNFFFPLSTSVIHDQLSLTVNSRAPYPTSITTTHQHVNMCMTNDHWRLTQPCVTLANDYWGLETRMRLEPWVCFYVFSLFTKIST
jgi:hypothetical protein